MTIVVVQIMTLFREDCNLLRVSLLAGVDIGVYGLIGSVIFMD